jgi:hypothetical protein
MVEADYSDLINVAAQCYRDTQGVGGRELHLTTYTYQTLLRYDVSPNACFCQFILFLLQLSRDMHLHLHRESPSKGTSKVGGLGHQT